MNVAPLLTQPVGTQVDLEVSEAPIDARGDNAALLEAGALTIDAEIRATHTNPGAYLEGEATAQLAQTCSRCLRPIEVPVTARFAEQYYARIDPVSGEGLREAPRDAKTIGTDFRIDLTPLLREELILASPLAPLCRADCKGLCVVCGEDLNVRPHDHQARGDERWTKLEGLLRDFREEEK